MDLCVDYCFPVKYICGLSKAKFKIGPAENDSVLYYDMIIDVGDRKTLEYYLENMKRYVNMVNRPLA